MRKNRAKTIFTLGHSNRTAWVFIQKLRDNKIDVLVDVRTTPYSRFSPQFNKNALYASSIAVGIQYLWRGRNLGGMGVNEGYEEALNELVALTEDGLRVCVVCSEADYRKCHRYLILTPALEERGCKVVHILYDDAKKSARLL